MFTLLLRCRSPRILPTAKRLLSTRSEDIDNIHVGHARFLAESSPQSKWTQDVANGTNGMTSHELQMLQEGRGKLTPTPSHLFKLILPLGHVKSQPDQSAPPTIFLLHPSQPLSHVSRLIVASLAPPTPTISFRSPALAQTHGHQQLEWSDSTDVGDFIKHAARSSEFSVIIRYPRSSSHESFDKTLLVQVPTFADRTRYLRRQLDRVNAQISRMKTLKKECDDEAYRGAKRVAVGGLGMLVVYWGTVARLTFWDYGWDTMEPITYLSGLSTVVCGYLWFLYRGREVTYSSVLDSSVSARRRGLYNSRGFDIEKWVDLQTDAKSLRREISKIAQDYDENGEWTDSSVIDEARHETASRHGVTMEDPALDIRSQKDKNT